MSSTVSHPTKVKNFEFFVRQYIRFLNTSLLQLSAVEDVDCVCEVSMTLPTHVRSMIVIPSQGMIDVRDAMTDILAEFGKEESSMLLACLHCIVAFMHML